MISAYSASETCEESFTSVVLILQLYMPVTVTSG